MTNYFNMLKKTLLFLCEHTLLSPYLTVLSSILNLEAVIKLEFTEEKERLIIIAFQSPW